MLAAALAKTGGLLQLETHVQTNGDHHDGQQERNTPTPNEEGVLEVLRVGCGVEGNPAGQQQHEAVRKHEADGAPA